MALLAGSPAIDAGLKSGVGFTAPLTDQRGSPRDLDNAGAVDIGAYEALPALNIVVNTTGDETTAGGTLSLREAIDLANGTLSYADLTALEQKQITATTGNVSTITFDGSLDGGTITLATVGDSSVGESAFLVNTPVVIDGPAGDSGITLAVDAATPMRLFDVTSTGNLTLQDLTLSGGKAQGFTGGIGSGGAGGGSAGLGGAIFNQGSLTILDSTLTGNTAQGGAGGSSVGGNGGGGGGAGLAAPGGVASAVRGSAGGGPNGGAGGTHRRPAALPAASAAAAAAGTARTPR